MRDEQKQDMSEAECGENRETALAEAGCIRLINIFAHLIDARRFDDLLGLMTSDCTIEWPGNRMSGVELVESLKVSPDNIVSMHVISTSLFGSVGADKATCVSYLSFYQGEAGADGIGRLVGPAVLAQYHDCFERLSSGWRISGRVVKPTMMRE